MAGVERMEGLGGRAEELKASRLARYVRPARYEILLLKV